MPNNYDNCWLTYCEPMDRKTPRVSQTDIPRAIEWYQENTGKLPHLIALSPKNVGFEGSIPDGIELRYVGGVLRGEIWLAASEPVPMRLVPSLPKLSPAKIKTVPQDVVLNMQTVKNKKTTVCIIPPTTPKVTREKRRGPKQRDLPVELIERWSGEGMGSKAIAARLKRESDIKVHYSTISRILSGQRVLV